MFEDVTYDIYLEPYPVLVIDNLKLCGDYQQLFHKSDYSRRNNDRVDSSFEKISGELTSEQKNDFEFVRSAEFLQFVTDIFKKNVSQEYERNISLIEQNLKNAISGRVANTNLVSREILLSANTPVTFTSSVRSIHLDYSDKYMTGLIYLDPGTEHSEEGNLVIYRWKNWVPKLFRHLLYYETSKHFLITEEFRVRPKPGRAVFFLNSIDALHGVTPRQPTSDFRIFYNYIIEGQEHVYWTGKGAIEKIRRTFRRESN